MQKHKLDHGHGDDGETVELDIRTIGGQGIDKMQVKKGTRLRDLLKDRGFNTKAYAFQFKGKTLAKNDEGELEENPEITESAVLIISQTRFVHGRS